MSSLLLVGTIAAVLLVAAVAAWVFAPLLIGAEVRPSDDPRILALLLERERALAELRDLDESLSSGRIMSEDHADLRRSALDRAAATLRALDLVDSERSSASEAFASRIERELEKRSMSGGIVKSAEEPAE